MEKMNNMNELDEMRLQIQALKDKVEKRGVLNEQLVRKSIKDNMKGIRSTIYMLILMVIVATPIWILIKYQYNLSWPLFILTILIMYVSVFFDWYINRMEVGMNDDLKETALKLVEMKKRRTLQEKIGCFVVIPIWMIWFCYEFFYKINEPELAIPMIIAFVVGALIGGAIGLSIFFKWQRKNDEMIQQINDLMKEEE